MSKKNGLSRCRLEKPLRAFVADPTASQTALVLGLSRTTVNRYYHLFRTAIAVNQRDLARVMLCTGTVEVDESYFGPTRPRGVLEPLKRGRGTLKQPVFGVFERGARVFTEIVPDTNKQTLQSLIRGRIALEATAVSDGWRLRWARGCRLRPPSAHQESPSQSASTVREIRKRSNGPFPSTDGIESFWSFTKRRLARFNGVSVNFDRHLKEWKWRWAKQPDTLIQELKSFLV